MARKLIITALQLIFASALFAQQSITPSVGAFTRLSVFGNFDIELIKGETEKVSIESDDVDLSKVSVSMQGDLLKIKAAKKLFNKQRNIRIKITYVQLNFIRLNAGAYISSADSLKSHTLKIIVRNGATLNLKVEAENIFARIGQGATLGLEGSCKQLEVRAANGGLFNAYELQFSWAKLQANSGAILKVGKSNRIEASAVMGGQISYRGTPAIKIKRTSFGGIIERLVE